MIFTRLFIALLLAGLIFTRSHGQGKRLLDPVDQLARLAKTWGYLKYYHPQVGKGPTDWDSVLVSFIPRCQQAQSAEGFNAVIMDLIEAASPVPACRACRFLIPDSLLVYTRFDWLKDAALFTAPVMTAPQGVAAAEGRLVNGYVSYKPGGAEVDFGRENPYSGQLYPDERLRLLALFRYWNVINYFYPHHGLLDRPWEEELTTFIPLFRAAPDAAAYHAAVARLVARLKDSHASATSPVLNHGQKRSIPFEVATVEGKVVVTKVANSALAQASGLRVGDVVVERNGAPLSRLVDSLRSYYGASNEAALRLKLTPMLLYVDEPAVTLSVERGRQRLQLQEKTYLGKEIYAQPQIPAPTPWQQLPNNIGYVDLRQISKPALAPAMESLMTTKGIIFDLRGYPEFILYDLTAWLLPASRHFAKLILADLRYPGAFRIGMLPPAGPAQPRQDYYKGKVVVLINENALSRAEFTAMALQAVPGATLIGSPTAGADGTNTRFLLPGGIRTSFSGQGIIYPDGKPTQGMGIQPDIVVKPTIAGIRRNQDEVLDRAVLFLETGR